MLFSIAIGYMIYNLVDTIDFYLSRWSKKTDNKIDDMLVPLIRKTLRITIVIIVLVYIAENLSGKTIGTLIAGLGIGGLAVALAAQDTLKNFFASVVIMIDQPFQMGDRVLINDHDGPVEEVGFRSTKIRTLEGHLVTIPNSEVANQSVLNIGKRPYIRRLSNITITYDTPPEKVAAAVKILKEILAPHHDKMPPDFPPRIYFNDFNDWSLNILMLYWFSPPDYWAYQEFNNQVNLEILKKFNAAGIDFAFPSQTLYMANDDKRQLAVKMLEEKK
jgi:MscS family membrane protein